MIDSLRSRSRKAGWVNIHIGRGGATLINCSGGRSSTNCDAVGRPVPDRRSYAILTRNFCGKLVTTGENEDRARAKRLCIGRLGTWLGFRPGRSALAADPRFILELGFLCRRLGGPTDIARLSCGVVAQPKITFPGMGFCAACGSGFRPDTSPQNGCCARAAR